MALLVVRMADEGAVFLPSGTLESFRADLGLTYAQAGMVLALVAPGALLGGAFSAAADRFSRRMIAAGGTFAFALSLAMFAGGRSFAVFAFASLLMGSSSTAMVDAAEIALVELVGDDLRSYLARSNLLASIGDLAGPALIAGVAALGWSWRVSFGVAAVVMVVYGLVLSATPLPPPVRGAVGEEYDAPRSVLLAVLRDPAVWVIGVMGLLMVPFDEPLFGFTIALLEQARGASAAVATLIAFIGVSGGVVAFTVIARRVRHVDDHVLLVGSVVVMTVAAVAIAVVPFLPVVAVAAFVVAVALSLAWLAVQHRSLTLRPGQIGSTKAVLGVIEFAGFGIPVAVGALADRVGLVTAVGSFGALGAALVALAVWDGRRRSVHERV